MTDIDTISKRIKKAAPGIESDLLEFVLGYFQEPTNDLGEDGLLDFLEPLLSEMGASDEDIQELCASLAVHSLDTSSHGPQKLDRDAPLHMNVEHSATLGLAGGARVGDIRHTMSSKGPTKSTVDQDKLNKAEAKLAKKKAAKGQYDPDAIPEWNPDVKPQIIVNQQKLSSESKSKDIKIENFDISYAGRKILLNATLTMSSGKRYGLVGKNGAGKSTLLRAIAHKELLIPSHIRVLHVEQEIHGDGTPALLSVLQADVERESLLEEERELSAAINKPGLSAEESSLISSRLKSVYAKLEEIESDKAESKAAAILNGLGFSPDQQKAATKTFSGGWRMRLALARALFCRPDLLLADEVTNFLDFPAVVWLENYFQNWNATLLVVSHDRSFLDAVATDVIHLTSCILEPYRGNFSSFVSTRAERVKNQLREYEAQVQYRKHLQDFIDRWRYNAKRAAQAQSKIKILEKLPPLEPPPKDEMEGLGEEGSVYFRFNEAEKLSPPILQMDNVTFGYNSSRTILKGISFDLRMDSKIAIVGPNGAGKSTMIYLLTNQTQPTSGRCHRHGRLRIALFSQHHVDQLELGASSVQFLQKKFPGFTEEEYRRILGRYGLTGTTALQPIGTLSGGQKSRVVFAWMSMQNPHVLILDEPTNHLDMDSIDALASALRAFNGGVAVVSHDERFLDAVCNEVWVCQGGTLSRFEGKEGVQDGIVRQYKKSLGVDV